MLYEKSTAKLAITLFEYLVLRTLKPASLIDKFQAVRRTLKEAETAISIFTHAPAKSLGEDISFMSSVITKILKSCAESNPSSGGKMRSEIIEKKLNHAFSLWKSKSKEIGLASYYMEPASQPIATEILRNIINSCI